MQGDVIAKYIRLSMDDGKSDSLSIETQREMLEAHIAANFPDAEVLEFVDNGFSGTNFERPGIQELLKLVQSGGVNCVIVKDFSRFGRNRIEVGYFIERVFPLYGVRFISLSDCFDSAEHEGGSGGLEMMFKMVIHEQYSRDLSQKIRTANRVRMQNGERISKNCVFGYKKVADSLAIDEPAAETVRRIFSLRAEGKTVDDIAKYLYAAKRPTPSEHRKQADTPSCIWKGSMLSKILSDEQYIGTYVAGKTVPVDVGGKQIRVPESEWIRIPDHHPAIVDADLFRKVQREKAPANKQKKRGGNYPKSDSPLKGKVVCACCNHKMQLSNTKNAAFHCKHTRIAPDAECNKSRISRDELEKMVLEQLKTKAKEHQENDSSANTDGLGESGREDNLMRLYERYVLGEMDEATYKEATAQLKTAHTQKSPTKNVVEENLKAVFVEVENMHKLSADAVDTLLEQVLVWPDGSIEILWKALLNDAQINNVNK